MTQNEIKERTGYSIKTIYTHIKDERDNIDLLTKSATYRNAHNTIIKLHKTESTANKGDKKLIDLSQTYIDTTHNKINVAKALREDDMSKIVSKKEDVQTQDDKDDDSSSNKKYNIKQLQEDLLVALVNKSAKFVTLYQKSLYRQVEMIETIIKERRAFTQTEARTFDALTRVTQATITKLLPSTTEEIDKSTNIQINFNAIQVNQNADD